MLKFIIVVNLLQLVACWLIYVPSFIIHKVTKSMKRMTFVKIALGCMVFLGVTDILELAVLVIKHQPVSWLAWACPLLWAIVGISYHNEYLQLKEEEPKTPTPPSEHP